MKTKNNRKLKIGKDMAELLKRFPVKADPSILPRTEAQKWDTSEAQVLRRLSMPAK